MVNILSNHEFSFSGYLICILNIYIVCIPWRSKWQTQPVSLPGEFHGQRSLVDCSPWGHKELDMTEWLILLLSLHSQKRANTKQTLKVHKACSSKTGISHIFLKYNGTSWILGLYLYSKLSPTPPFSWCLIPVGSYLLLENY